MNKNPAKSASRRRSLKTAGTTALAVGAGPAVIIPGRTQPKTLKIVHRKDVVASYIQWLDDYAKAWGETNDIRVTVDWLPFQAYFPQVKEKITAQQGHYDLSLPVWAELEDQVIDHRELYEECKQRYGRVYDKWRVLGKI